MKKWLRKWLEVPNNHADYIVVRPEIELMIKNRLESFAKDVLEHIDRKVAREVETQVHVTAAKAIADMTSPEDFVDQIVARIKAKQL